MDNNALILAIVVALVTAIPPTMVAYSSLKQSQKNAEKTDANTVLTADTNRKVEEVGKQADEIKATTNGSLSEVKGQLEAVTAQAAAMQMTIKTLTDVITTRTQDAKKQSGELIEKVGNGNTATYDKLASELAELKEIMAGFAKDGMPVIAPEGEPLPVVAVKAGEVKK